MGQTRAAQIGTLSEHIACVLLANRKHRLCKYVERYDDFQLPLTIMVIICKSKLLGSTSINVRENFPQDAELESHFTTYASMAGQIDIGRVSASHCDDKA